MSNKRVADRELNADNWDDVDEPEDAGKFKTASQEILQQRVIKTAKRRMASSQSDQSPKGIFEGFKGFNKTPSTSSSPFSFLSNLNGKPEEKKAPDFNFKTSTPAPSIIPRVDEKKPDNDNSKVKESAEVTKPSLANHSEYCANLKSLNLSVCEWIKSHIDKNPYCLLTPIFDDYKKYLKELDKFKTESNSNESGTKTSPESVPLPENKEEKKPGEKVPASGTFKSSSTQAHSVSIFSGTLPQTNKSEEKSNSNLSTGSSNLFNQGFSSTPISKAPMFSFGQKTSSDSIPTSNFSFGTGKPFSFGNLAPVESKTDPEQKDEGEEDEEPPKATFTPVVEEGSIYSKRCKVFVKKDGAFGDRGVGTLYLKPITNSEKYQLIVRADTSLGNLLLNIVLSESVPTQRMGKNNVMLICIPTPDAAPPPVSALLRVKTADEADQLLSTLDKYKK